MQVDLENDDSRVFNYIEYWGGHHSYMLFTSVRGFGWQRGGFHDRWKHLTLIFFFFSFERAFDSKLMFNEPNLICNERTYIT